MLKFVGFKEQFGTFTADRTGEVIPWSKRYLLCVTDQGLEPGSYGYACINQKVNTVDLCRSLNIPFKLEEVAEPDFEKRVNDALTPLFHEEIDWVVSIVKGSAEVIGFRVIPNPVEKPNFHK